MIRVRHVDTWADYNGTWIILGVTIGDQPEFTRIMRVT